MRRVDQDKTVRLRPMRLLILGISRTGTTSLCIALDKLGYKTFHMNECLAQPTRFFPLADEMLKAKFAGEGKPWGRAEFDKLLGDYDAVSDLPMALFADELIAAYPEAKVILTTRDAQKWVTSMQSTIWLAHSWWTFGILAPFHTLIGHWRRTDTKDWDSFINSSPDKPSMFPKRRDYLSDEYKALAVQRFHEHNDHIRKIVPRDNLLEFQAQDGWKPLCKFLGHDVPAGDYPRAWDAEALVTAATGMWWAGVQAMLMKVSIPVVLVGVAGWWAVQ